MLMTRRQLNDPFGSDDEDEEPPPIIDDKKSGHIQLTRSQSSQDGESIHSLETRLSREGSEVRDVNISHSPTQNDNFNRKHVSL
ncbi:unnamed protein product, partial [Timema podura]|nr:unnamed protein product [Timema podura]